MDKYSGKKELYNLNVIKNAQLIFESNIYNKPQWASEIFMRNAKYLLKKDELPSVLRTINLAKNIDSPANML